MKYKNAIITGASSGIGRAVALSLSKRCESLALIARSKDKLAAVQAEIEELSGTEGPSIRTYSLDVCDEVEVVSAIDEYVSEFGGVHILFNNAGIYFQGLQGVTSDQLDQMLRVNILGAFHVLQAVIPHLVPEESYVFHLSSRSGKIARPNSGAYAASKFGFTGLSEAYYQDLVPTGIKLTSLCPSFIRTPMTQGFAFPQEDMIDVTDITRTVDYLLDLSSEAVIKEIVIECRKSL